MDSAEHYISAGLDKEFQTIVDIETKCTAYDKHDMAGAIAVAKQALKLCE